MIEPDSNRVKLTLDNRVINYDYLVIATGCDIHPEETEGLEGWRLAKEYLRFLYL